MDDEIGRPPDGVAFNRLSRSVFEALSRFTVFPWPIMLAQCKRVIDPNDEASYAMIRECDDWNVNGQKVGFQCKYAPEKKLIEKCPWFRRR